MRVGYIRVSSVDQNPDRQLEGIQVEKVYIDKTSGATLNRPQFNEMMNFLREGDMLVVYSMDRLARKLFDLKHIVQNLTSKKIQVQFIKENITLTGEDSPMAHLTLSIFGAFAEFEREIIRERQREGIEIAKRKGKFKGGKGKKLSAQKIEELKKMVANGHTKMSIAKNFNISLSSVYNYWNDTHQHFRRNSPRISESITHS